MSKKKVKVNYQSPASVAAAIDRLTTENARLTVENRILVDRKGSVDPLVVELQEALLLAELAQDGPKPVSTDGGSRSAETPLPDAHVKGARTAERGLRSRVGRALAEFSRAADYGWYPPKAEREQNLVRCRAPKKVACSRRNRWVNRWLTPPGPDRIELVHCPECGQKMSVT